MVRGRGGGFPRRRTPISAQAPPVVSAPSARAEHDVVTFCAGADNLPLASKTGSPSGLDVEIARVVAAPVGFEPGFPRLDAGRDDFEEAVRQGRCDAALGVPVDPGPMAEAPLLDGLVLTHAYHATGYVLVRRSDAPPLRTLREADTTRLAVEGESIFAYTLRQRGRRAQVPYEPDAVIGAVAERRARYGYLWGPIAGWMLRGHPQVLVDSAFRAEDRWQLAMAARAADSALRRRLDAGIAAALGDGTIDRICRAYGGTPGCAPAIRESGTMMSVRPA